MLWLGLIARRSGSGWQGTQQRAQQRLRQAQRAPVAVGGGDFHADQAHQGVDVHRLQPGDRFTEGLIKAAVQTIQLPMGLTAAIDESVLAPAVNLTTPTSEGQSLHREPTWTSSMPPAQPVAGLSATLVMVCRKRPSHQASRSAAAVGCCAATADCWETSHAADIDARCRFRTSDILLVRQALYR